VQAARTTLQIASVDGRMAYTLGFLGFVMSRARPEGHGSIRRRRGRSESGSPKRKLMRKIYVSDNGNDSNDGLTEKTPIRSWQRFIQLCEGNDEIIIMGDVDTGKMRLIAEIDKKGRLARGEVAPKVS
jgi:hypothetical protein